MTTEQILARLKALVVRWDDLRGGQYDPALTMCCGDLQAIIDEAEGECSECRGSGVTYDPCDEIPGVGEETCRKCNGTGKTQRKGGKA